MTIYDVVNIFIHKRKFIFDENLKMIQISLLKTFNKFKFRK